MNNTNHAMNNANHLFGFTELHYSKICNSNAALRGGFMYFCIGKDWVRTLSALDLTLPKHRVDIPMKDCSKTCSDLFARFSHSTHRYL